MGRKALIICIKNYNNFQNLPDGCWNDARRIGEMLWKNDWQVLLYPRTFEFVVQPESKKQNFSYSRNRNTTICSNYLAKELEDFFKSVRTGEDVLVYIVGHAFVVDKVGTPMYDRQNNEPVHENWGDCPVRLAVSNSHPESYKNSISFSWLSSTFQSAVVRGVRSLTILLDCCYAGRILDWFDLNQLKSKNFAIALACGPEEESYIQKKTKESESSTYFTIALKNIFNEYFQDSYRNFYFTDLQANLASYFNFIKRKTEATKLQNPEFISLGKIKILRSVQNETISNKPSNKCISYSLNDLQTLDYRESREQFADWLDENCEVPRIGFFYLESNDQREITWHFSCLLQEIDGYPDPRFEQRENTKNLLQDLCGKEVTGVSSQPIVDINEDWISGKPILILIDDHVSPSSFSWIKIVQKLDSLPRNSLNTPFMFWFFGRKDISCGQGFIKNDVKIAFEYAKKAINFTCTPCRFCTLDFSQSDEIFLNQRVNNEGRRTRGYDFRAWGNDRNRRNRLAETLKVNPDLVSRVLDGMSLCRYAQADGYQAWTYFFEILGQQETWKTIQYQSLPYLIEFKHYDGTESSET